MRRWPAALAAAMALAAPAVHAEDARWYMQMDNDLFFDTDRWYSSGVRVARVAGTGPEATEWAVMQEIWSPEGKKYAPGVVDRTPTARLQGRFAWHHQDAELLQTIELGLGVRGRSAGGERTTRFVHRFVAAWKLDWSREVPSELDASAAITRTHGFGPVAIHYGAVAGNELAYAHAGLELRAGAGNAAYSPVMRHVATPPFALDPAAPRGVTGFVGISARRVVRNRLLDAGYDPEGPAPTRKDWVARAAVGLVGAWTWGEIAFALARETREFAEQRRPQDYGSVVLRVAF